MTDTPVMEPGHTPGPFAYRADRTIADVATGTPLARCYADRNEAFNGPLFAAAPALLEALEDAYELLRHLGAHDGPDTVLEQARAAISLARSGDALAKGAGA